MTTESNLKIFIGGIPRDVDDKDFGEFFETFGSIEQYKLMRNGMGISRGFGFVTCKDPATYEKILNSDLLMKGRKLDQKKAVPMGQVEKSKTNISSPQCKIFIGGLPPHIEKSDLVQFFSKFGDIKDSVVQTDSMTGKSRGFGFVTFMLESSVEEVLKNPRCELGGRMVQCKRAQPAHVLKGGYRGGPTRSGMMFAGVNPNPLPVYGVHMESPQPTNNYPLAPSTTGYGKPTFQVGGAPPVFVSHSGSLIDYSGGYSNTQGFEPQQGIQQPLSQHPLLQVASFSSAIQSYNPMGDVQSYRSQDRYQPY